MRLTASRAPARLHFLGVVKENAFFPEPLFFYRKVHHCNICAEMNFLLCQHDVHAHKSEKWQGCGTARGCNYMQMRRAPH